MIQTCAESFGVSLLEVSSLVVNLAQRLIDQSHTFRSWLKPKVGPTHFDHFVCSSHNVIVIYVQELNFYECVA